MYSKVFYGADEVLETVLYSETPIIRIKERIVNTNRVEEDWFLVLDGKWKVVTQVVTHEWKDWYIESEGQYFYIKNLPKIGEVYKHKGTGSIEIVKYVLDHLVVTDKSITDLTTFNNNYYLEGYDPTTIPDESEILYTLVEEPIEGTKIGYDGSKVCVRDKKTGLKYWVTPNQIVRY